MHNARMTMPNPFLTMPMPAWQRLTEQPDGLSESPFWHAQESRLYWVDIPGRRIGRMRVQGLDELQAEPPEYWDLPEEPGCLAPVAREDGGGLVLARRDGVFRARAWGGAWELLAAAPYDTTRLRFNDGKCDPRGRLWVGTMYEPRGQSLGVLYRLDRQAGGYQLQPMAHGAIVANGLAWSPDARTLYWSCTGHHQVRAWQFDADSGTLAAERVFQSLPKKPEGWAWGDARAYEGRPDGASVDAEGAYWSAQMEGACLKRFASDGRLLQTVPTPVLCPTMPCFGGPDGRTLFITSASDGRPAHERQALPGAGCIWALRVPVPGLPVQAWRA